MTYVSVLALLVGKDWSRPPQVTSQVDSTALVRLA